MEGEKLITFLFGAGSAGTVVGSFMLWRLKQFLSNVDEIPNLVRVIHELKTTVDGFAGELRSNERSIHKNHTSVAVTEQKVEAAFRQIDNLKDRMREFKL